MNLRRKRSEGERRTRKKEKRLGRGTVNGAVERKNKIVNGLILFYWKKKRDFVREFVREIRRKKINQRQRRRRRVLKACVVVVFSRFFFLVFVLQIGTLTFNDDKDDDENC